MPGHQIARKVIRAYHNLVINPVNSVLFEQYKALGLHIRTVSEDTHAVFGRFERKMYLSRVDFSWEICMPDNSRWVKFAVLEFKRPKGLRNLDWIPAYRGNSTDIVTGNADKICRTLMKDSHTWRARHL